MRLFILFFIVSTVIGCSSTLEPESETLTNKTFSKDFKFYFVDAQQKVTKEKEILVALADEILKQSSYPTYTRFEKGGDGIFHVKGVDVKVDHSTNTIYVFYLNGREYYYSGDDRVSKVKTQIQIQMNYAESGYLVLNAKVKPNVILQKVSTSMDGFEIIATPEAAINDTIKALEAANPLIGRVYEAKGEIVSSYSAESLFANFISATESRPYLLSREHLAGTYYSQGVPITIQAFPYKKGSRLVYQINIPYTLQSDGQYSLSKSLLERLKNNLIETATR